jgi:hypothetical protein
MKREVLGNAKLIVSSSEEVDGTVEQIVASAPLRNLPPA